MSLKIPNSPEPGQVVQLMPGLLWLRMPIPFKLDHVNIWLFEDEDGWTAIDTGVGSRTAKTIWEDVVRRHLGGKPLKRVLVTHCHPDHVGLAGTLCRWLKADLLMSRTEWLWTAWEQQITEMESRSLFDEFARLVGLSGEIDWDTVYEAGTMGQLTDIVPRNYRRIQHGDRLRLGGRSWEVITGGGHSLEHVCLYSAEAKILVSADHVLPKISPNIGVSQEEPESNPLGDFLITLAELERLPADTLVLPSHNEPFYGLRERIGEMVTHHEGRLEVVRDCCDTPTTVVEASRTLFPRQMSGYDIKLAVVETWAHLNYLVEHGRLVRWIAEDGAYRFHKV